MQKNSTNFFSKIFLLLIIFGIWKINFAETNTDWNWFGDFPWIYNDKEQDWHYLKAGSDGQFYLYKNSEKTWYFFESKTKNWSAFTTKTKTDNSSKESNEKSSTKKTNLISNLGTVQSMTLTVEGVSRDYQLYIPTSYDGTKPLPIVFNFHGFGGTASDHMKTADMRTLANNEMFFLVYPQGSLLGGYSHWNAAMPGGDNKSTANDTGFFEAMLTSISSSYKVDPTRVYACGYSNGGFFSYFLAGTKSNLVAAIGSVSGTMLEGNPDPTNPTPVISIHGTSDTVVPFSGGNGYLSNSDVLNYWANKNGAITTPVITNLTSGYVTVEKSTFLDSSEIIWVEGYKINGGDHVWFDLDLNGFDTNQLIWNFFSKHSLKGPVSSE